MRPVIKQNIPHLRVILLLLFILAFSACTRASYCWYCQNLQNPSESRDVCDTMTKNKLESYGYKCTPL